jgi:hypothetical protein
MPARHSAVGFYGHSLVKRVTKMQFVVDFFVKYDKMILLEIGAFCLYAPILRNYGLALRGRIHYF